MFASTPPPPYYVVIFTSLRNQYDEVGYEAMAERMLALAQCQAGFLGAESARGSDGLGITVSYWRDEASIQAWRNQLDHLEAQRLGRTRWYERYSLRVAHVERAYEFSPSPV
ncbi:heme-degrading monooxygenase HmoA [Chitinivorax tropicus]|uniref:Heme-degrading monooxygenase HmoA n=1 Tax=Chitinivorax tropicus TaxID=714531 RepID=A0A840MSU4_9PROT|nr:heme-degrading monooxygenase HmoA [Chitinivorax tropicus]